MTVIMWTRGVLVWSGPYCWCGVRDMTVIIIMMIIIIKKTSRAPHLVWLEALHNSTA